jgi:hypothetical protein
MKVVYEYSHLGGSEIMQVRYPEVLSLVHEAICEVMAHRVKISQEKTKLGRALYSPSDMNAQFHRVFRERGFQELRDHYTITIPGSEVTVEGAYKQVDFVRDGVLVEVQFGKYAFMFYDMAKFQYFFN